MSATFQRMKDNLLRGLEDSSAAYIDDVVVHSVTWADHLSALRAVLTTLKEAGLTAKPAWQVPLRRPWQSAAISVIW